MPNNRVPKAISLDDFMPKKESKRKDEGYSRENRYSSRRRYYDLRSKDFWNIKWEDSDEEDHKPGFVPRVKNWADCVDDRDPENSVDIKSPEKRNDRPLKKDSRVKRCLENSFDNQKNVAEGSFPALSNRKRERNGDDSPRKFSVSNHPEFVKRRLRSGSDGVSTTSSSMNSSDTEQEEKKLGKKYETDLEVLGRRQKQIDYGKNTKAYRKYLEAVPVHKRTPDDIFTPKKHIMYSRRSWDSQIKIWRKRLHAYDKKSDGEEEEEASVDLSDMISMMSPK